MMAPRVRSIAQTCFLLSLDPTKKCKIGIEDCSSFVPHASVASASTEPSSGRIGASRWAETSLVVEDVIIVTMI